MRLVVNEDYKDKDFIKNAKALGLSVLMNGKDICVAGVMLGWLAIGTTSLINGIHIVNNAIHYNRVIDDIQGEGNESNEEICEQLEKTDTIFFFNSDIDYSQNYHLKDDSLYDKDDNMFSLKSRDNSLGLIKCKISNKTLDNIQLASSNCKELGLNYSSITDGFIKYLPESLEYLALPYCNYVSNLDGIAEKCPNLKELYINNLANLEDYDFIYDLPNLETVEFGDGIGATDELLNYLKENNIETDLTERSIANTDKLNKIIEEIIVPSMNDREKIQAVCLYVLDNVKYDIDTVMRSNDVPIDCVLDDGRGVCESYAYFTNALLKRAGINSYSVANDGHAWNLVELDGEYYYIDNTATDDSFFYKKILEMLNISGNYMVDTNSIILSGMSKYDDAKVDIPIELIEEIKAGNSNKGIIEKYGWTVGNIGIFIARILANLSVFFSFIPISYLEDIPYLISNLKEDYENNLSYMKKR